MAYTNAIFYLDYENGNDSPRTSITGINVSNPSGTITRCNKVAHGLVTGAVVTLSSFSTWLNGDWKITVVDADNFDLDNAVWQTTADTDGNAVPFGGSSWSDAWKTIGSGATSTRIAPGDTIRIAKSPAPVSLGTAQWTGTTQSTGGFPATKSIVSSTNATPIVVTCTSHGYSNGDVVQIISHGVNTQANGAWVIQNVATNTFELVGSSGNGVGAATGTVQLINSKCVVLSTAQNLGIDNCETAWTANGTGDTTVALVAVGTDAKEGSSCMRLTLDASVQTNKMQAYRTIPTTDFSGYQGICFWIKQSSVIVANNYTVTLCSDTLGATVVDTFSIPAIPGATGQWTPMCILKDGGGNLGSSIQSIAINTGSVAPTASSNILVDNFFTYTSSGLNLCSLVSKNSLETGGDEAWYGIQSINKNVVVLDNDVNCKSNSGRGYSGTTESVTTYFRKPIPIITQSISATIGTVNDSGTLAGGYIEFAGGYNTSTSIKDGETFYDGRNGAPIGIYLPGRNYIKVNNISFTRFNIGVSVTSGGYRSEISGHTICNSQGSSINVSSSYYNTFNFTNCNNGGTYHLTSSGQGTTFNVTNLLNNNSSGLYTSDNSVYNINIIKNNLSSITFGSTTGGKLIGADISKTGQASFLMSTLTRMYMKDCTINDATELGTTSPYTRGRVMSINHNGTGYDRIFTDGGIIDSLATDRSGGTGKMWKINPKFANSISFNPVKLPVARVAVSANNLVTVKAWMKKDNSTGVDGRLVCEGGQIAGVTSDVVSTKANDTSWEELTITFTPTESGVVEITAYAEYVSGNYNVYVEDMTITQA